MQERSTAPHEASENQSSNPGASDKTIATDDEILVSISKQTLAELKWLAEYMGVLPSNALRQAIATQAYLEKEIANGHEILIKKPDGLYKATMRPVWREDA